MAQLSEMDLLQIQEQLRNETAAIVKYQNFAQQTTEPRLQQMYRRIAQRHQGHLQTLMQQLQTNLPGTQY